jgi:RNA polymerase sigma-70 factor (ECF subfamily)
LVVQVNERGLDRGGEWDWRSLRTVCSAEARRILGSDDAVQDATQEALLRAWRKQSTCQTPADPAPWMRAIARREALRIAARPAPAQLDLDLEQARPADDTLARSVTTIDLTRALDTLGAAERAVVILRYGDDLTQAEAARRLDIPAGTARTRLHRARVRLHGQLDNYDER